MGRVPNWSNRLMDLWLGLAMQDRDSGTRKDSQLMWERVYTAGAAAIGISCVLFDTLLERCRLHTFVF